MKNRIISILKLLSVYWLIELFFLLFGIIVNEPLPNFKTLIYNLFGLNTGVGFNYINVSMAWYVSFYIILMLVLPILQLHLKINIFIDTLSILFIDWLVIYITSIFSLYIPANFLIYFPAVAIGFYCNYYSFFDNLEKYFPQKDRWRIVISVFLIFSIIVLRFTTKSIFEYLNIQNLDYCSTLDSIYTPLFIISFMIFFNSIKNKSIIISRIIIEPFKFIGKYSMYIWFLHSIFFTPNKTIQSLAYLPQYSIIIILWVILLMIPISIVLSIFNNILWKKFK